MHNTNINEGPPVDSPEMSASSRSGSASGTLRSSDGVTGCEDTPPKRLSRLKDSQQLKVATWNCGGLTFTTQEQCKDLEYDILVLTETHDNGKLKSSRNLITAEPAAASDPYAGVAIMLSDSVAKCVKHRGSSGSRIVFAEIAAKPCNLFIIGVYIPHSNRKQAPFATDTRASLDKLLSSVSPHMCTIVLGDFNCKLGRKTEQLTGQWCIHKKPNQAGLKTAELLRNHKLSAISTFFKPVNRRFSPSRSNATYLAKDPLYKPSQIDYVAISKRWATSVQDCKVKWGISCLRWGRHYDHGLIECRLKMRIRMLKSSPPKDYSILKSDPDINAAFNLAITTNLSEQNCNKDDPTDSYANMCIAITKAANSALPAKKSPPIRRRQVSSRTKELYNQRKSNYESMNKDERKSAQHAIVKSTRDDYQAYIDSILNDMETAERTGNTRMITKLRKSLSGNSSSPSVMPSKDINGKSITSEKQLLESWNSFLSQKFAQPDSDLNLPTEPTVSPRDILMDTELEEALKSLKAGKVPGSESIPIEVYNTRQKRENKSCFG